MTETFLTKFKTMFCKHVWLKEPYGYSGVHYTCIFCDKEVFKKPHGVIINEEGQVVDGKETLKTNVQ